MKRRSKRLDALVVADAVCRCRHRADKHDAILPSPCLHDHDGVTLDPDEPGYGCPCIGFVALEATPHGTLTLEEPDGRRLDD